MIYTKSVSFLFGKLTLAVFYERNGTFLYFDR